MTPQLNHLIARQWITDSREAADRARLVAGERRRIKPMIAVLALCGAAALAGGPARAHAPRAAQVPAAQCEIRLPISLTAGPSRRSTRRYAGSGSATCTGWLGPWFTSGRTGSASSYGAISLPKQGCVASAGHGRLFAVVPRQTWFFSPEVTLSGAFRWHRAGGLLRLAGHGQLVHTREAPVSARLSLSGTVAFARRAGQACHARRLRGTLTLQVAVKRA